MCGTVPESTNVCLGTPRATLHLFRSIVCQGLLVLPWYQPYCFKRFAKKQGKRLGMLSQEVEAQPKSSQSIGKPKPRNRERTSPSKINLILNLGFPFFHPFIPARARGAWSCWVFPRARSSLQLALRSCARSPLPFAFCLLGVSGFEMAPFFVRRNREANQRSGDPLEKRHSFALVLALLPDGASFWPAFVPKWTS